jgi:hypothetical protein
MDSDVQLKKDFAANLLRYPDDPAKAAFATTPSTGLALQIAKNWIADPVVLAEQDKLLAGEGAKSFLPTKEAQARDIYAIATSMAIGVDERIKAHRLYAEVMGFIEKPNAGNAINVLNQGVMVVRTAKDDQDWEDTAVDQQRKLIAHATVN